jgi:hypothetical protein
VRRGQSTTVCDVDEALVDRMRKLRFRKDQTNAALISMRAPRARLTPLSLLPACARGRADAHTVGQCGWTRTPTASWRTSTWMG